jgi:putative drug exporter of the RND superfamily
MRDMYSGATSSRELRDVSHPTGPTEPAPHVLARAFAWVVAGPLAYVIPVIWIAFAVWAAMHLPSIAQSSAALGDLTAPNAPAIAAQKLDARLFGVPAISRVAVVQHAGHSLPASVLVASAAQARAVDTHDAAFAPPGLLGALPIVNQPGIVPASRQARTTAITYLLFDPTVDWNVQVASAEQYARELARTQGSSVVGVSGVIPARLEQGNAILGKLTLVEIATIVLIALIVGLTFRSLGAPLVTLGAGVVAYIVAAHVVAWVGQHTGTSAPQELQPLMIVLLLGIVTDYSIFFLSGMRRQLALGRPRMAAARAATGRYLPTILAAGVMVAAGTACLVVARLSFFSALGPGMALTVLIGLAVAVTLVPSLLAVFGALLFWPHAPVARGAQAQTEGLAAPAEGDGGSLRARLVRLGARRPVGVIVTVVGVALLVLAATGTGKTHLGFGLTAGLPASSEAARAASAASAGFAPGILSPTEVIVQKPAIGAQQAALAALETQLGRRPGVAGVFGPRESLIGGARLGATGLSTTSATIAKDGNAARFLVVFDGDPLGSQGIAWYDGMRAAMPAMLARSGLAGAAVAYAGDTPLAQQTLTRTVGDLRRVGIAVIVVELVLLIIFLRALVGPLYLLAASVLALVASFGLTVYVFQDLLHEPDVVYFVPFAAAVLLVSLGSDYNIFLVGRIWEQARIRPLREAIEVAVPRATRAISVAALALALSFALLALIDLQSFRQLAFLLLAGVLIDSFFVRSLLVPALVTVFGRTSAWPGRLRAAPTTQVSSPVGGASERDRRAA